MNMTHSKTLLSMLALVATLLGVATTAAHATSEDDFRAAYAAAVDANKQAGQLRDQWTVTATALADAKKAVDAGDFDKAIAASKEAEALAKASVFQATSEKDAWKAMEIH
jgi:hypothetical protein